MYQASCARTGRRTGKGGTQSAMGSGFKSAMGAEAPAGSDPLPRRLLRPLIVAGGVERSAGDDDPGSIMLAATSSVVSTAACGGRPWRRGRAWIGPSAADQERGRSSAGVERDRSPCASQAASCGDAHMGKRQRGSSPPTFSCECRLCAPPMRLFRFFRGISCPSVAMHELCRISVPTLATRCLTSQAHLAPGGSIRANRGATHISTSIAPRLTVTLSD